MKCKLIAITGQIGSGKSVLGNYLKLKGYVVVDCDNLSRQIASSQQTIDAVATTFGGQYVIDGALNREKIRAEILADSVKCGLYNQLFFDKIRQLLTNFVQQSNEAVVFVEIPLIDAFEYPWYQIWQVTSPTEMRVDRVTKRDNVDESDVLRVSVLQVYNTKPTHVVVNDGTIEQFYQKIDLLLCKNLL